MAKTYSDLLVEARELLQDTATDATLQRYTDSLLTNQLNRGLIELYRTRPDAFYDLWDDPTEDFLVPSLDNTTITDAFGLPMMFYTPLISYVVAMTSTIDDEFNEDSRAMSFLADFKRMVNGL